MTLDVRRQPVTRRILTAALIVLAGSLTANSAELSPETLRAWDEYVQAQDLRVAQSSGATSFLWSEQSPDRIRRLRSGEILVAPVGENPYRVPHGLIHHWIGAAFLPDTRLADVLAVVRDYGEYKDIYAPNVIESKVLRRADTDDAFSVRMLNKAVVSKFALDAEFHDTYTRVDRDRWYSIGYSTRIREIEDYGLADEHGLPANTGRGFIWRLYSISRFEQRDGGVYVEVEAIALSRDVPGALRWLVNPIVRRVSRSSMLVSLQKTEGAVFATSRAAKEHDDLQKSALSNNLSAPRVENGFVPY